MEYYFTTIKRFVYISVMIKLHFENPKLDTFEKKIRKNPKKIFKFMYVLVLVKLRFLHKKYATCVLS